MPFRLLTIIIILYTSICQQTDLNIFLGVQTQHEQFYSYLPFIQTCYYNQSNINPGSMEIYLLGPQIFYTKILYWGDISFWGVVANGLQIASIISQKLQGYDGYILYDSQVYNFHRQLIFYNINQGQLLFTYVLPTIDYQTLKLNITIMDQIQVALTPDAEQILENCPSTKKQNFAFVGNKTFMYVCGNLKQGFTFVPFQNQSSVSIINFTSVIIGDGYKLATNPQLYDLSLSNKQKNLIFWNCILLSQYDIQFMLYFLSFNFTENDVTVNQLSGMKNEITLIINRIWGFQQKSQVSKWMDVYSSLNISSNLTIPGNIISVFVSKHNNIFIQSAQQNATVSYLIVFDSTGNLYWNYSFVGSVIYYGSDVTFIYNENIQKLYAVEVSRPYFVVNSSLFPNQSKVGDLTYFNFTIPCEFVDINVNYTILWTSIEYPTYLIVQVGENTKPLYSKDSIYAIQSSSKFQIIGPDFLKIPNSPPYIDVQVIDSQTIIIYDQLIGIVDVETFSSDGFGIILASNTSIYVVSISNSIKLATIQPCGFNTIVSAQRIAQDQYEIINQDNKTCICVQSFQNCSIVNIQNIQIFQISANPSFILTINSQQLSQTILVKKNLYDIIGKGLFATILQNNSVFLISAEPKKVLDMVTMDCKPNSTNGVIFTRQFYPPFLVLYCQGGENITQFVIDNEQIVFRRVITLYGFKTRKGLYSIRNALSYILIEVDPLLQYSPYTDNCCVLKLDFRVPTVSVIQQIINASTLLATSFYKNYDIALLETQTEEGYESIVKIYFLNQWFTFNYTNFNQIVSENVVIPISFWSPFYNFGSYYDINITFNLTLANLNITLGQKGIEPSILLSPFSNSSENSEMISSLINYNFSQFVCGPIFSSFFLKSNSDNNIVIIQNNVLTNSKIIGKAGMQFIQIIDPEIWNQDSNFSLNNILLFVTVDKMLVYAKVLDNIQLVEITNFTLPQQSCTYYLDMVVNQTSVRMSSNCEGVDLTFQIPVLTVNYNPQTRAFTYTSAFTEITLSLSRISTIPILSGSYLVGILQGPMNAETGRLVICSDFCQPMYISTKYQFLIDYSTYSVYNQTYYVMAINSKNIEVFIEPLVTSKYVIIQPNYTIAYTNYVHEIYCSTIKILNVSNNDSFIILSCSAFYYFVSFDFYSGQFTILNKFSRYSQCDTYDTFQPEVIQSPEKGLQAIFTQCRQNDYSLQLNVYDSIVNNKVSIYTGYLQVFIFNGPLGPNCSTDSISPITVIPVSTSTNYPLFTAYRAAGGYKFIYCQLEGVLVDNFLVISPQFQVIFRPKTRYYSSPTIQFIAVNQFQQRTQMIQTTEKSIKRIPKFLDIITFAVYIIANLTTLVFTISYFVEQKSMKMRKRDEYDEDDEEEDENENQVQNQIKQPQKQKQRKNRLKQSKRDQELQLQLQLYFDKSHVSRQKSLLTQ